MKQLRSLRWFLLALIIFGAAAQQQASAQIPVGTTKTGTFIWDGERWIPAEGYQPPAPPQYVDQDAGPAPVDVEITADSAPPPLPDYDQPPCPEPNLIWTPGYWHFGFLGYYWVPGAWVPAPYTGALWTPGYWGFEGGHYGFHGGYWGPHVGFYGGVNYGGGFMGIGFAGGAWNGGVFAYNTAVVHVNVNVVTNVYVNRTIVEQTTIVNVNHVAFNGGPNGIQHQPTPDEQVAMHETHMPSTSFQKQHVEAAKADTSNLAKNNGGHPTKLADAKPLQEEKHAAPAGFKPPPQKPVAELAKAQAPPATVAAAQRATTKAAAIAKSASPAPAKPPAQPTPKPATAAAPKPTAPPAANTPKPVERPAVSAPAKPATQPTEKTVAPPSTKPVTPAHPAETAPKTVAPAGRPAAPPAATTPRPAEKTAAPPAAKPVTPAPKPAEKPATAAPKPAPAPKAAPPAKKPEKEKKPE
jgi:hypothetical protein